MAVYLLFCIAVVIGNQMLTAHQASALESSKKISPLGSLLGYLTRSFKNIPTQSPSPPVNTNKSIHYLLYTPDNPEIPCYLEPTPDVLKRCPFNSSYPMKFLIHGFLTTIQPGGPFMLIKDEILRVYKYNVIVMDWSPHNQFPYIKAATNTLSIGHQLADLIQFLQESAGVDAKNIHLIGHSLGAHLSGAAGEKIPNLGRITGLDPASRFFSPNSLLHRLTHSDADFVDIIHSSNHLQGFGEQEPTGHLDFYPNGGENQPHCEKESKNPSFLSKRICNHSSAVSYFLHSVNSSKCNFLASKCDSYTDFQNGLCSNDSTPLIEMGLPAKLITGLPPKSEFFLKTSPNQPYCLQHDIETE